MKARIVQIGNSRGVRLPKALLEQANLVDEVEIEAQPDQIIIRSAYSPREGWEDAFKLMAARGDDALVEEPGSTAFDEAEWQW
jgi:antitoxin MazE